MLAAWRARDLQGFAAAGIESDHEITSGEDLVAKLRAGFTVELRGSHDYVLPGAVEALNALPPVPQTLTICTDDVFPDDLVAVGGMIDVLRRLVRYGLAPMQALRCATLNAAMRLGRRDLGLVAPGRRADLLVLSDLRGAGGAAGVRLGRLVAADGRLLTPLRPDPPGAPVDTVHVPPLTEADFRLAAPGVNAGRVRLRTVAKPRFTAWGEAVAEMRDGAVVLPEDAIFMAVIHRHGKAPARPVLGVLQGWSTWRGALATTVAHDSHNLVVFGREPADLAAAANAVVAAGGGMAVAARRRGDGRAAAAGVRAGVGRAGGRGRGGVPGAAGGGGCDRGLGAAAADVQGVGRREPGVQSRSARDRCRDYRREFG